jgi:outer membrane protein TolC
MANRWLAWIIALTMGVGSALAPAAAQQPPPSTPGTPAPAPGTPAPGTSPSPPPPPSIPAVPTVPVTAPRSLSLTDALTTALTNNFQIRQAALTVAIQRATLRQAEGQKALTLSTNLDFTANSAPTSNGGIPLAGTISIPGAGILNQPFVTTGQGGNAPVTQWAFGLTLRYPLYTGNALEDQIAIAQANVAASEAQFASSAEQVVFTVRQAFYLVQASQANVDAAQRAVDASQENVRVTQAQVQVGTSPQFNLLQAQVQLAQSQQSLTTARTGLSQAHQSLAAALVLPLSTTFERVERPPLSEVPQDVAALIQQAMQNRPEIVQALASERAAQAAIDLAAAGLRPNITVSAGPQVQTSDPTNRDVVNFTGTVALTLAILDGGVTQAKIDQARAQLQSAQVTEAQVRQQVELDVRNAYLSLGNAAESLRSALAGQTAARESLRIANVRFQAGVGTQLEVVTQIQNLATADNQVIQAELNYFVAVAQLDRAIGVQVKI